MKIQENFKCDIQTMNQHSESFLYVTEHTYINFHFLSNYIYGVALHEVRNKMILGRNIQ